MNIKKLMPVLISMSVAAVVPAHADVLLFSSQANTLEESNAVRNLVVRGHSDDVEFIGVQKEPWASRMEVEGKANASRAKIGLSMGLHGQFSGLDQYLDDHNDIVSSGKVDALKNSNPALLELAKLGGDAYKYIPVMQASYIFAANVKAFDYLPEGLTRAQVESGEYTYAQLLAWGKKMKAETGANKVAFPAGDGGLIHRFFQGYLYPSFTGGVVTTFDNDNAQKMWAYFDELWEVVDKRSEAASHMQELLLLSDGPWVVFDHTSRLKDALDKKADEIVALPAPSGAFGKGFMTVLAGLSIPKNTPDRNESVKLLEYMMKPGTQVNMLLATGFYPVVNVSLPKNMPASSTASAGAIATQSSAGDSLPALLPSGLGDKSGLFSKIYTDTFQQIVLRNKEVGSILPRQTRALNRLMKSVDAPCWAPDAPSEGACQVN